MHRRKKRAFSLWHAATALAAVGGTGLFAAAVALQGRPVRVHVLGRSADDVIKAYQARRSIEDGSGRPENDAVKRRGGGDDDISYSAADKFDADVVGRMVDAAIAETGVRFSHDGIKLAHRVIKAAIDNDNGRKYRKGVGSEYQTSLTRLREYISTTVKTYSTEPKLCRVYAG